MSLLAAALCILRVNAQQDSLGVKLLELERQVFLCVNEAERNELLLKKVELYVLSGETSEEALAAAKRISPYLINDKNVKQNFFWNAALLSHLNHDFNSAASYFSQFLLLKKDTTVSDAVFGALIYNGNDTGRVASFITCAVRNDSSVTKLLCLNEVASWKKKGKAFFVFSSYLIPGAGSMMLGHVLKGAVSLILFAGIGAGVYLLVTEELYLNALLFATPWLGKFYGGQVRLTRKLFHDKEIKRKSKMAARCQSSVNEILIKYPVEFIK